MSIENPDLGKELIEVVTTLTGKLFKKLKEVMGRLKYLVEPPPDLQVRSTEGHQYTGLIAIERNEVEAGIVARVGRVQAANTYSVGRPLVTPEPSFNRRESPYLRSWAEQPEEEEPWNR